MARAGAYRSFTGALQANAKRGRHPRLPSCLSSEASRAEQTARDRLWWMVKDGRDGSIFFSPLLHHPLDGWDCLLCKPSLGGKVRLASQHTRQISPSTGEEAKPASCHPCAICNWLQNTVRLFMDASYIHVQLRASCGERTSSHRHAIRKSTPHPPHLLRLCGLCWKRSAVQALYTLHGPSLVDTRPRIQAESPHRLPLACMGAEP